MTNTRPRNRGKANCLVAEQNVAAATEQIGKVESEVDKVLSVCDCDPSNGYLETIKAHAHHIKTASKALTETADNSAKLLKKRSATM